MRTAHAWRLWCRMAVAALGSLFAMQSAGCSLHAPREVDLRIEAQNPDSKVRSALGQDIVGYTTADSVYHEFTGRVRLAADVVAFLRHDTELRYWNVEEDVVDHTRALESVATISARDTNTAGVFLTVLFVAGSLAVIGIASGPLMTLGS